MDFDLLKCQDSINLHQSELLRNFIQNAYHDHEAWSARCRVAISQEIIMKIMIIKYFSARLSGYYLQSRKFYSKLKKPFQSFDQLWKFEKLPRLGMIVRGLTQPVEQDKLLLLRKETQMWGINKLKS